MPATPLHPPLLVSLVGHQPLPPLLVARRLRPMRVVLLVTDGPRGTRGVAARIAPLLGVPSTVLRLDDAHRIDRVADDLAGLLPTLPPGTAVDLTGGAKPSALALLAHAQRGPARGTDPLGFPRTVHYLTSGAEVCLDTYRLDGPFAPPAFVGSESLPPLVSVDDYLKAHLGAFREDGPARVDRGPEPRPLNEGGRFERAVGDALWHAGYDVRAGVRPHDAPDQEFDLVACAGNKGLLVEVKLGKRPGNETIADEKPKRGIEQALAAGTAERFGTFGARMLVRMQPLAPGLRRLADVTRVAVVVLGGARRVWPPATALDDADTRTLLAAVHAAIGPPDGPPRPPPRVVGARTIVPSARHEPSCPLPGTNHRALCPARARHECPTHPRRAPPPHARQNRTALPWRRAAPLRTSGARARTSAGDDSPSRRSCHADLSALRR